MNSNVFHNPAIQHLLRLAEEMPGVKQPSSQQVQVDFSEKPRTSTRVSKPHAIPREMGINEDTVTIKDASLAKIGESAYAIRKEKEARSKASKVSYVCQSLIDKSPTEDDALALMPIWLLPSALPYQNIPQDVQSWSRYAGKESIVFQPGTYFDEKTNSNIIMGYPNGKYPRLVILYLTTCVSLLEAKYADKESSYRSPEERTIRLRGDEFLPSLLEFAFDGSRSAITSAGERGLFTLFKEQFIRLLGAHITVSFKSETDYRMVRLNITDAVHLKAFIDSSGSAFWNMSIVLSENFYNAVKARAVPVDVRIAKFLGKSPQALDIYCWLSQQVYLLNHVGTRARRSFTWDELFSNFGPDIKNPSAKAHAVQLKTFKRAFVRSLENIQGAWRSLAPRVETSSEGVMIHRGITLTVPPTKIRLAENKLPTPYA